MGASEPKKNSLTPTQLQKAVQKERELFEQYYNWLSTHMPASFFEKIDEENLVLIVHSLINFPLQDFVSHIHAKSGALVLCLDSPDADLRILEKYHMYGIKNYRTFLSDAPAPFPQVKQALRVAVIHFTAWEKSPSTASLPLSKEEKKELFEHCKKNNLALTEPIFQKILEDIYPRFHLSLPKDQLSTALDVYYRATTKDPCQYEVQYSDKWQEKNETSSMRVILAWRGVPRHKFLYHIAKIIYRHNLSLKKVHATYINPYSKESILVMSLELHGKGGKAAWDEANVEDFLQELAMSKYFPGDGIIETTFVDTGLLTGNFGNLLQTIISFVHQILVHADINMYNLSNIEEAFCRHPEITTLLCEAFKFKFHPESHDLHKCYKIRETFLRLVKEIDTGHESNDIRRKNILQCAMNFIHFTLKSNFYRKNKTAFSFRLSPQIFEDLPFDRKERFPELPYAIFFMKGMYYLGFHIRFKDLSRGGLRTIYPQKMEQMLVERNFVLSECYSLAYTQHKKNKDIPEGGSKGVIFLEPYERLISEADIYKKELENAEIPQEEIIQKIEKFHEMQKLEYLYQSQRSYVESFLTILNCLPDGTLKAKRIVDYWKHPEYIYLGPDENMHNSMIEWISAYSQYYGYKPGRTFISSKPGAGINHKEYGVTSLGVNAYMEQVLLFLGIDPSRQTFTVKMTGGPDGDVAGNQILNLRKYYPNTAKLIALTDGSGTIYDPNGLDLNILEDLFKEVKPIRFYPPQKLSEGGFLLDLSAKKEQTTYSYQTLCWSQKDGKLSQNWLSGNEMNHLYRGNILRTRADVFIPAGGRPRTINEKNYKDFLDQGGNPTSKVIIEGANLFLTSVARKALEKLGVLIVKDSSANKGGVICSSFEVLAGLILSEEEFLEEKAILMKEILQIIKEKALEEAALLLETYKKDETPLTEISDKISERIISYKNQLLDYFELYPFSNDPEDPLIQCLFNYCPQLLRQKYKDRILSEIPTIHKKSIIACYIASRVVYKKGLSWHPTIIDVLPLLTKELSGEG
ncbi:MAG: glutamate dehydrogenase [Chlamydiae bacterium]|nr:glutamate dehydrogenase [Chlamydiota bacterium]